MVAELKTYVAWLDQAEKALQITNAKWQAALRGPWRRAFEYLFEVVDLDAALDQILRSSEPLPNRGRELFDALKRHASSAQQVRLRQLRSSHGRRDDWSVCDACGNTGLITVPLLGYRSTTDDEWIRLVVNGAWQPWRHQDGRPIFAEMAVLCRCSVGRKKREGKSEKMVMTIETYEERNPDWRSHMMIQDRGRQAEIDAEYDPGEWSIGDALKGIGQPGD